MTVKFEPVTPIFPFTIEGITGSNVMRAFGASSATGTVYTTSSAENATGIGGSASDWFFFEIDPAVTIGRITFRKPSGGQATRFTDIVVRAAPAA